MRKILLLTFVLFPSLAQAIECESPQICTLKASEVCTQQHLKFFGEDECIECDCPDGGEAKEVKPQDGSSYFVCCKGGYRWEDNAKQYSWADPEDCGCPDGGEAKEVKPQDGSSYFVCCKGGYKWEDSAKQYSRVDPACGCPDGGEESSSHSVCCKNNYQWDRDERQYSWVNAKACGCPDGGEKGSDDSECCKNNYRWFRAERQYSWVDPEACGCPDGGEVSSADKFACCKNNYEWDQAERQYSVVYPEHCGCPDGGEVKEGKLQDGSSHFVCCKGGFDWDWVKKQYSGIDAEACGCPDGGEVKEGKLQDGSSYFVCCKDGYRWDDNFEYYSMPDAKHCGCPDGGEVKGNTCCKNGYRWMNGYNWEDVTTCGCPSDSIKMKAMTFEKVVISISSNGFVEHLETCRVPKEDVSTDRCCKGKKEGIYCCENDIPTCSSSEGILIEVPNKRKCQCGCYNNFDCNQGWTRSSGKIWKTCQDDYTCTLPESFSVEGIRVEIQDFNGGKLNQDKITRLVQKIRSDLLATTGNDNVKIVFTGVNANIDMSRADGFARFNDSEEAKSTIYIKSGGCEATNDETWTCEGTIVHENIHRVENLNQPGWNSAISALKTTYRSCLSETHAHAEGTRKDIVNALSKCYYREGSGVKSVCEGTNANSVQCKDCKVLQQSIQIYGGKYVNKDYAQKYFDNPKWFEANNCQGLRAELEEAWLNDVWQRSYYYDRYLSWIRAAHLEYTKNDLWIEKAKLAAQLKRTNWLWNNNNASLPEMMAELYNENQKNSLCMSPKKFAMNPNWNAGLEKDSEFVKFTEAHDFFKTNSACLKNMASNDCANFMETMECLDSGWRTDCTPVSDFLTDWFYQPLTFTIPGGF